MHQKQFLGLLQSSSTDLECKEGRSKQYFNVKGKVNIKNVEIHPFNSISLNCGLRSELQVCWPAEREKVFEETDKEVKF